MIAGWRRSITSDSGLVIPEALVEVFIGETTDKATLFADRLGAVPLTNPFNADAQGFAEFYTEGGRYRIEAGAEGAEGIWSDVLIGTAQGLDVDDVVAPGDLATVATTGDHVDLLNKGTNTHAQIDSHIDSTANPHSVDKAQVGLGNVDNVSAASLRDRATHTGVQAIDTVTGLQVALDSKAAISSLGAAAFSNQHQDLSGAGTNTHSQIDAHIEKEGVGTHGSASDLVNGKLVHRDSLGRAKIAAPAVDLDIANKAYVDSVVGSGMSVKRSLVIDDGAAQLVNDLAAPAQYTVYGRTDAGVRGWNDGAAHIRAFAASFRLVADVSITEAGEYNVFSEANSVEFGGNRGMQFVGGPLGEEAISANSGGGGTYWVTAYIKKTGAGTIDLYFDDPAGQITFAGSKIRLVGAGDYTFCIPVTILAGAGGIRFRADHVSGSSAIDNDSNVALIKISGQIVVHPL